MDIQAAEKMGIDLMRFHGIENPALCIETVERRINNRISLAYVLDTEPHRIYILRRIIELNDESRIKKLFLHEIAHLKRGPRFMHDLAWRILCKSMGGDGHCFAEPGVYKL